jgi:hypothetical protein
MVASCLSWFSVFITSNDKTLKRGCQEDISFGLAQHVLFYFAIVIHDYLSTLHCWKTKWFKDVCKLFGRFKN